MKSSKISSQNDPSSSQEDWLNRLLTALLTNLSEAKSFSHGENTNGKGLVSDYLDSIYSLSQDEIELLMPEKQEITIVYSDISVTKLICEN